MLDSFVPECGLAKILTLMVLSTMAHFILLQLSESVSFSQTSSGRLAMVIYEWNDVDYLGKETSPTEVSLPVCTPTISYNYHYPTE